MTKVKDYQDLSNVPLDKLYKLRDVANDNCIELHKEYVQANDRLEHIKIEILNRLGKEGQ